MLNQNSKTISGLLKKLPVQNYFIEQIPSHIPSDYLFGLMSHGNAYAKVSVLYVIFLMTYPIIYTEAC